MSTLGGIYNFNGAPVDKRQLIVLGNGLANRLPDGGSEYQRGFLGMIYRAFHTTKGSRQETQPLTSSDGHILCWDGRLDNRGELVAILHDELCGDPTDVAIALASYRRWGSNFLPRLIGDFALSLWDPSAGTLILARDLAGPRPLFYYADKDRIIWSSELSPLLDLLRDKLEINDEYVAGYLISEPEPKLTPYKSIYAVPPGHVVIAQGARVETRRFWGFNPNREIRYGTDTEYEEHFRHLFREAVRCRLRVDGPAWATLSGGLDSSAIVCMADEILESGEAEAARLETVSYVYGESATSDERKFILCVEEKRGRAGHHLLEEDHPLLASFPDDSQLSFPDFLDCFVDRHRGLCEAMRADGARVLLTGHGGDQMLCSAAYPSYELGDLLVQCRLSRLHRSLRAWSRASKKPYLKLLWQDGVTPLLPQRVQIACRFKPNFKPPPWLDKQFIAKMNLCEHSHGITDDFGFRLPSGREQAREFLGGVRMISKASHRARGCIEVSHPFLHRPLIEFLQAIPLEQKLRPGETRSLLRRAMRGSLPEKILRRKGKRGPEEALFRAIRREWSRLQPMFEDALICARGYVNAEALMATLDMARHGCLQQSFSLIKTISLEFWLRALERQSSAAENTAAAEQ
jgi:asparagine synthase (glutamine-hydrolysing)